MGYREKSNGLRASPVAIAVVLLFTIFQAAFAEDRRTKPIDAYILIDCSTAMGGVRDAVTEWICSSVIENLLFLGDRVTVWAFAEQPVRIAAVTLGDEESKETLKQTIRGIQQKKGEADFSAAIRAAEIAESTRIDQETIALVLVASTLTRKNNARGPLADPKTEKYFQYSKVEDHAGWKMLTVGLGLEEKVKKATAAFFTDKD